MIALVFIIMIVLLILSAPIAVALGLAVVLPSQIDPSFMTSNAYIIRSVITGTESTTLLAIPLFVLAGSVMTHGGISRRLFDVCEMLVGKMRGGIPCAVILTCMFYGAISGSGPATCAAVGAMAMPILLELGYDRTFSAALIASAAGLGIIIPPSIPMILWGTATGASVGDMFIGGIIPGILITLALMAYTRYYCSRNGEDRAKIDNALASLQQRGFLSVLKEGFWAILTPVIILGGIYSGLMTPTEAASIAVVYALIVSMFIYKSIRVQDLWGMICESIASYGGIMALIALASAFSRVLSLLGAPQALASWLLATFPNKYSFLIALNIVLLLLGMLIDCGPAIVIIGPLLTPIAEALNINLVHLGLIVVINLAIGFVSPPFGLNLFVASPIAQVSVDKLGKKAIPFALCIILVLLLITYIP
jgi:C4-dicarboxylate transporter DctM subunit